MSDAQPAEAIDRSRVRLPLKLKLSLVITVLVVVTVGLVAAILLRQEQQTLTEEMTRRGRSIAEGLAASVKQPLLANDEPTLSLLLKDATADRDVAYVIVTDHTGRIVGHGDIGQVGRRLERPPALQPAGERLQVETYADPARGRLIDFSVPLSFSKVRIGALYVGFSTKSIEATLARARAHALLITAIMVVVGIVGAVALSTVLSRPILRLVEATRAISAGDFQVSLAVPSTDEIGALTESFNQMARSLGEKEAIKRAFSVYVAREVVNEILKDPHHPVLKGERREVTVLFCDMRGFTALVERLPPKDVLYLLEEFYTVMIDTTLKHDGTLDKFLGDGVMAIFGAPNPVPDHAYRAIQAALDMQAGVREISARRAQEGKDLLTIGVGISAGEVVAGTVGTSQRMEYTVVGDSVNLAARLEADAKPGQILISRATFERVRGRIEARSLGMLRLRGKELPVEAFEVLGGPPAPGGVG
jgi:adenylate cyclase